LVRHRRPLATSASGGDAAPAAWPATLGSPCRTAACVCTTMRGPA